MNKAIAAVVTAVLIWALLTILKSDSPKAEENPAIPLQEQWDVNLPDLDRLVDFPVSDGIAADGSGWVDVSCAECLIVYLFTGDPEPCDHCP